VAKAAAKERHDEQAKVNLGIVAPPDEAQLCTVGTKGKSRDAIAKYISEVSGQPLSGRAYKKEGRRAGARSDPEQYGHLVERMDRDGAGIEAHP
jgi:hypothetical protein